MTLSPYTLSLLADTENRLDPETEEDFRRQWEDFWADRCTDTVFRASRKTLRTPETEIKKILINDALDDYELMLAREMGQISQRLATPDTALGVRCNYGTGILSSLFGAEIFTMEREKNTLPTTRAIGDTEAVRRLVESGIPPLTEGFGRKVFEMGEFFAEAFRDYPNIQKYVQIYHPDTQGPLDIAELLWGGEMFIAMYEEPELVHAFLRLITDTYKQFLDKWFALIPNREGLNVHLRWMHRGNIFLRNDSAMNLSPALYEEFAFPYDNELLNYFGGGCVHFCGRGDHYIDKLTEAPMLYGINFTQPQYNDMDKIYAAAQRNGKKCIGIYRNECLRYEQRPDAVPGMVNRQDK